MKFLDAAALMSAFGTVLSLVFAYVPKVKDWFEGLDSTIKPLVNMALVFAFCVVVFGLSCANVYFAYTCDLAGATELFVLWLIGVFGNQVVGYQGFVKQFKPKG